jgi:DNA-binding NtrC family response regulator
MDGIETLQEIKKRHPLVEVIMLTGHGTIETAIEGMKLGAFDFLLKPSDFDDLFEKLKNARRRKHDQLDRIRKAEAAMLLRGAKI